MLTSSAMTARERWALRLALACWTILLPAAVWAAGLIFIG